MASTPTQLTLEQAHHAATLWLEHANDPPIEVRQPAHGTVELVTQRAFVRVRWSDARIDQASVLALLRAGTPGRRLVIFSTSGFSPGALSVAETQGIALYRFDETGRAHPETSHARSFAPDTEPDPPFPRPNDTEADDSFWGRVAARESLAARASQPVRDDAEQASSVAPAPQYRCRTCGSHDIEVVN